MIKKLHFTTISNTGAPPLMTRQWHQCAWCLVLKHTKSDFYLPYCCLSVLLSFICSFVAVTMSAEPQRHWCSNNHFAVFGKLPDENTLQYKQSASKFASMSPTRVAFIFYLCTNVLSTLSVCLPGADLSLTSPVHSHYRAGSLSTVWQVRQSSVLLGVQLSLLITKIKMKWYKEIWVERCVVILILTHLHF